MTFSILARDPDTGALGGAAATGNLCVGGWVLRGKPGIGVSASQGYYPSTLWGEDVLDALASGLDPDRAIELTVNPDAGRDSRQLLALDRLGNSGVFSGAENTPEVAHYVNPDICAGGNMLARKEVVKAAAEAVLAGSDSFLWRLLSGLRAGSEAGGDARGLMSAAILIFVEDFPPIDLRVDYDPDPLNVLERLISRTEDPDYVSWIRKLPTQRKPFAH
ncbi:DUF1028 domain-containing protein [Roseibium sp. HPY-6]|uniref:DUF1028 domain-containing protein n=1 Tax=Roseibium sp. HPY-6 TaxID=3229852 RepID=UPI00339003F7